jgi:hydrogenase maturation factor
MVLVVPQDRVSQVLASLKANGEPGSVVIGSVTNTSGDNRVDLQGLESWDL